MGETETDFKVIFYMYFTVHCFYRSFSYQKTAFLFGIIYVSFRLLFLVLFFRYKRKRSLIWINDVHHYCSYSKNKLEHRWTSSQPALSTILQCSLITALPPLRNTLELTWHKKSFKHSNSLILHLE